VIVVEVMGRDTGWVAIVGGLAGGADFILIPEVEVPLEVIAEHLEKRAQRAKSSSIIVVAEGQAFSDINVPETERDAFGHVRLDKKNVAEFVTSGIERLTGFETRATVLGHLQRGGSPTVFDRVLATRMGVHAIEQVKHGRFGRMVALQGNEITSVSLRMAIQNSPKKVNQELWRMAQLFY
ncbi:MAG: 6-phosphofructokinase, partial [Cyanobacteria bacterium NC_groundwater_1444_Ag_S-0.65um_54_12]|nr:6-phosphofructokinase [Cyanobacteria bacterium NC_groundwater_1444_Ag_S-0.65um_54_12]